MYTPHRDGRWQSTDCPWIKLPVTSTDTVMSMDSMTVEVWVGGWIMTIHGWSMDGCSNCDILGHMRVGVEMDQRLPSMDGLWKVTITDIRGHYGGGDRDGRWPFMGGP